MPLARVRHQFSTAVALARYSTMPARFCGPCTPSRRAPRRLRDDNRRRIRAGRPARDPGLVGRIGARWFGRTDDGLNQVKVMGSYGIRSRVRHRNTSICMCAARMSTFPWRHRARRRAANRPVSPFADSRADSQGVMTVNNDIAGLSEDATMRSIPRAGGAPGHGFKFSGGAVLIPTTIP